MSVDQSFHRKLRKSPSVTCVTHNQTQPYVFGLTLSAPSGERREHSIKVQAKNRHTKDAFYKELHPHDIKKIGFYSSVKGFYNRLNTAIAPSTPPESDSGLKAYYFFFHKDFRVEAPRRAPRPGDSMALVLEEQSKYDEGESVLWFMALPQLQIKDTVKLTEKLEDVVDEVDQKYLKLKQNLEFVVSQIKQKFVNEREERAKLQARTDRLEGAVKKLLKKLGALEGTLHDSSAEHDQKSQSTLEHVESMTTGVGERFEAMERGLQALQERLTATEAHLQEQFDHLQPKLAQIKGRRDFTTEHGYVEYICKTLDSWDRDKYGPILVRVVNPSGKAKHFVGYVGEPVKWNTTICRVKWFGLGKQQPEPLKWNALDVYLPFSAYYYPDCPHAKLPNYDLQGAVGTKM